MSSFIAAGSNSGDRLENLKKAAALMAQRGIPVKTVSPVYETPAALLYENAADEWNKPYLNCIFKIETQISAFELLTVLKNIEKELGRDFSRRWAPRPIDLDIITHNGESVTTDTLTIPHRLYQERSFVLDPLSFFENTDASILYTKTHQPIIMGIMNVTPDSFSDGGKDRDFEKFRKTFEQWRDNLVPIIDIGAESTRPGAVPLTAEEEGARLNDIFEFIRTQKKDRFFPFLSIDTYHPETAKKALESGFDIINDINGLDNPEMFALAKEYKDKKHVFMHHADIRHLPMKETLDTVLLWLEEKIEAFEKSGFKLRNMIFDPGIGFGKTTSQSLFLLQNIKAFQGYGVRILVGHSRKSFMKAFTDRPAANRNTETLAISLKIANDVDILRVHTPLEHRRALLAAAHMENQFF